MEIKGSNFTILLAHWHNKLCSETRVYTKFILNDIKDKYRRHKYFPKECHNNISLVLAYDRTYISASPYPH